VQRYEDPSQEQLVLFFQRHGKTVNDTAEDLEKFSDTIELLEFVDKAQERVVDLLADEGAQSEELSVDTVQDCLEEVAFTRVLAVEELKNVGDKPLVDVLFAQARLELGVLEETQKELVDDLQVRPASLVCGLIVLALVGLGGVGEGGQTPEYVVGDHGDDLRVDSLGETAFGYAYVVDDFVEAGPLDLFAFQVGHRVHEVKDNTALLEFFDEQFLLVGSQGIYRDNRSKFYKY